MRENRGGNCVYPQPLTDPVIRSEAVVLKIQNLVRGIFERCAQRNAGDNDGPSGSQTLQNEVPPQDSKLQKLPLLSIARFISGVRRHGTSQLSGRPVQTNEWYDRPLWKASPELV